MLSDKLYPSVLFIGTKQEWYSGHVKYEGIETQVYLTAGYQAARFTAVTILALAYNILEVTRVYYDTTSSCTLTLPLALTYHLPRCLPLFTNAYGPVPLRPPNSTISRSSLIILAYLPHHSISAHSHTCHFLHRTMKRDRDNSDSNEPLPSTITAMSSHQRVSALRALMKQHEIDAFIVPTDDSHMSEYVAHCDNRRSFITGFTGSAGTALITMDAALCWTDGRYFLQASKQLDSDVFKMMRIFEDPPLEDWLALNLPEGSVVAIDGMTVSIATFKQYQDAIAASPKATKISIKALPADVPNLIDQVWASARPALPASRIVIHPEKYAGVSASEKIENIRKCMEEENASIHVVTGLDEVAWLLNLRGSDIEFNPTFMSYVTVTSSTTTLYVNRTRFADEVDEYLKKHNVTIAPYDSLLSSFESKCWEDDACVWLDPKVCNYAILACILKAAPEVRTMQKSGPIPLMKARKSDAELDGVRACHVRDGAALVKTLCWLENAVVKEGKEPSECEVADKAQQFRSEQDKYVSLSFSTISASGKNGAEIHYSPHEMTCAKVTKQDVYLIDSGAQYMDGTTDVTRTMHFGEVTDWQKECFTRVLQGHIAIDTVVFPKGTTGYLLDGFARRALWQAGLDYKHGTGHGVGAHLNVHEGPHVISFKAQSLKIALEPRFLTSNEPGYYEEGAFGIRIENVCIVVDAKVRKGEGNDGGNEFYGMEHVTLCPIQRKMINCDMLSKAERLWIDEYHRECLEKLGPLVEKDEVTMAWLRENTKALKVS